MCSFSKRASVLALREWAVEEVAVMRMVLMMLMTLTGLMAPGCVVYEMRDQLHETNRQLLEMQQALVRTEQEIEVVSGKLETTNDLLLTVRDRLGVTNELLSASNEQVVVLQGQLGQTNQRYLESMEAMIRRLDEHLVSLRQTVADVTRLLPFVDGQRNPDGDEERNGQSQRDEER
jgi:chromosome segregation ATPase